MNALTSTLVAAAVLLAAAGGYVAGLSSDGDVEQLTSTATPAVEPAPGARRAAAPAPSADATTPPAPVPPGPAPSAAATAEVEQLERKLADLEGRHEATVSRLADVSREYARLRAARIEGLKARFLDEGRAEGLTPEQTDDVLALIGDLGELPEPWQVSDYLDVVRDDKKLLEDWSEKVEIEYADLRKIHRNLEMVVSFTKTMAAKLPNRSRSFQHRINGIVVPGDPEFLAAVETRDEQRRARLEQIFGAESARRVYRD